MQKQRRRRGLTLIELIVVLTILVAVAGLTVPIFPGLLDRTGHATGAANMADVDNMLSQFYATNLAYPDRFDSLIDSDGSIYSKIPSAASTGTNPSLQIGALTANQATSLKRSGIEQLLTMRTAPVDEENDYDATFDATLDLGQSGAVVNIAAGANVVWLRSGSAWEELRREPTEEDDEGEVSYQLNTYDRFVVFGFGDRTTAVGETILRPPVGFGSHRPAEVYQRMLVVFEIPSGTSAGQPARYVGSLAIANDGDDHLVGPTKSIAGFRKHSED